MRLSHAANPTNDSERLVFGELFETLIRLDCRDLVRPGLALSWSPDSSRRRWTFTLRKNQVQSASPAPIEALLSTWRSRPGILQANGIESVIAVDSDRATVTMQSPSDSVPRVLADPGLSVPYDDGSILNRDDRFLIPRPYSSATATEFRVEPGADPRDALDAGADLVVTRDPAVIEYVSARPEFKTIVLPWSRTYVLGQPGKAEPLRGVTFNASVTQSLAQDAVRTDARAAQGPFWWNQGTTCAARPVPTGTPAPSSRIVYQAGDAVSQGLAERMVALLAPGTRLRAAPLNSADFESALAAGSERAYILSVATRTLAPCRELAGWPADMRLEPLIDTRATAIVRRGSPPLSVDWDGTLRVEEPRDSP